MYSLGNDRSFGFGFGFGQLRPFFELRLRFRLRPKHAKFAEVFAEVYRGIIYLEVEYFVVQTLLKIYQKTKMIV